MASIDWNMHYESGNPPWETGRPSAELHRVIAEQKIRPCRTLELGCGSGINAVWLAQQGFDVTAVDFNQLAIEKARQRGAADGVAVKWLQADVTSLAEAWQPFPFFFDRGCYHAVRRENLQGYLQTLKRFTAAGSVGLVLTGNAREPHEPGPPVVSEQELRAELGSAFEIIQLREFRFDDINPSAPGFLAWSCLLRRT